MVLAEPEPKPVVKSEVDKSKSYFKFDLLQFSPLKKIMKQRWYQPSLLLVNLAFFSLVIYAGFFGTAVGNANFSIIFVWIVWWSLLIMFLVPFMGRFWCTICPIPALGEWMQRGKPVSKSPGKEKLNGKQRKWPKKLSNMWPATVGFLLVATFSGLLTTIPKVTAIMLTAMILISVAISAVFKKRTFCRYICPVGGFIGLYSQASALEVRVKDEQTCKTHIGKDCIRGNDNAYGCPWMEYPGKLESNTYCGMCMECLKACPKDNISLNVRSFGHDIVHSPDRRMDEAYKSEVMLGAALLYSTVLLGPFGDLKAMANFRDFVGFLKYGGFFVSVLFLIIPSFFWLEALVIKKLNKNATQQRSKSEIFKAMAYSLVPLGLMTWIGFSLLFIMPNWTYIVNVINDPFGWGWHLLGINALEWHPVMMKFVPPIIIVAVLVGLLLTLKIGQTIARELYGVDGLANFKAFAVHAIFVLIFTVGLLYSFSG